MDLDVLAAAGASHRRELPPEVLDELLTGAVRTKILRARSLTGKARMLPIVGVQAGVLLGELDRETQAFGFAVPAGG